MDWNVPQARRSTTAMLGAAALVAGCVSASASAAESSCSSVHNLGGGWSLIDPPAPPPLPPVAGVDLESRPWQDLATVSGQPDTLLVTDGTTILRSADAGCSWQSTFSLGHDAVDAYHDGAVYIRRLASAPPVPGVAGSAAVYAFGVPSITAQAAAMTVEAPPTVILTSTDGGTTWQVEPPTGLARWPRCSTLVDAVVSPLRPRTAYLVCTSGFLDATQNPTGTAARELGFRTDDGGASWQQFSVPQNTWAVATDPAVADGLWAVGDAYSPDRHLAISHSTDEGTHWTSSVMKHKLDGTSLTYGVRLRRTPHRTQALAYAFPLNMVTSRDAGSDWHSVGTPKKLWKVSATNEFAPDARDLLEVDAAQPECNAHVNIHRYPMHGRPYHVRVPKSAHVGWVENWQLGSAGGPAQDLVAVATAYTSDCTRVQQQPLLRYQPQ